MAALNQPEIERLWFAGESVPGARFRLNDSVRISTGAYAAESAAVISLLSLWPHPCYLVELGGTGQDAELDEAALEIHNA